MFRGMSLHRFYARLPNTGSSSSSGVFGDGSSSNTGTSASASVVPCSLQLSAQSGGNSVCNMPRKRKTSAAKKRRRSNPAVILVEPGDSVVPLNHLNSNDVVEVISLSSGASTASGENLAPTASWKEKGKGVFVECEDIDNEDDGDCMDGVPEQKKAKKSYEASRKFQDTWAARLPWAILHRGGDGLYEFVKCLVCSTVEGKDKILGPKWDTLQKHGGKRKATCDMSNGIKKDQWYIAKNCKHLRNERIYASRSVTTVLEQVTVLKGERARKQIQFATILHLLHEGRPMLEYTALHPLFSFLGVPKLPKKHWSDGAGWELAECLYKQVQVKTKATMQAARFFSITCDEVSTLDTQSWISIHGYVCHNWERKPLLLSLERVVSGGGSDSMTKVIVNAVKEYGGIEAADLGTRLASFGADGINTFQGKRTGVVAQLKSKWAPRVIGVHCMAHRTNLAVESLSTLPIVSRIENVLQSLHAFFAHSPKRHLEFQKLAELMHSKGLKILKNIKTRWISMLSPAVRVLNEYRVLLVKMSADSIAPTPDAHGKSGKKDKLLMKFASRNLSFLQDFQVLLTLLALLPLLRSIHSLIKFAQSRDVFICDYVAAIQICISELQAFYCDESSAFTHDTFWDFKALVQVRHDAIPMSWVPSALDLNEQGQEFLQFTPGGMNIEALYSEPGCEISTPINRELHGRICDLTKASCKEAAQGLISQLTTRFPSSSLMDAFGIVYPQYWRIPEAEQNFQRHIAIIKEHYCYPKEFPKKKSKKGHDVAVGEVGATKTVEPVLCASKLEEQAMMFQITMKSNCEGAMTGDLPLNPLTRLWRRLEASGLLRHKLSEYLKVVELAVVTVLGSVEDERTFSTLSFMKNKLRNRLNVHLPLAVAMHAQEFYTLTDFPYNAAYDEWKKSIRKDD